MARELVEKNRIGENADAIWRALHLEHQKLFPSDWQEEAGFHIGNADGKADSEPANLNQPTTNSGPVLISGHRPGPLKADRRLSRPRAPEQQSLFS